MSNTYRAEEHVAGALVLDDARGVAVLARHEPRRLARFARRKELWVIPQRQFVYKSTRARDFACIRDFARAHTSGRSATDGRSPPPWCALPRPRRLQSAAARDEGRRPCKLVHRPARPLRGLRAGPRDQGIARKGLQPRPATTTRGDGVRADNTLVRDWRCVLQAAP